MSGYSKRRQEKTSENYLTEVVDQYKKYKKMYVLDNTTAEFKGLIKVLILIRIELLKSNVYSFIRL